MIRQLVWIALLSCNAAACGSSAGAGPGAGVTDASSGACDAATDASPATDAACTVVLASSFDQSCTVDTDCVAVGEIPTCPANPCDRCEQWTINTNALGAFNTAFS
jgi:hypothetical protein